MKSLILILLAFAGLQVRASQFVFQPDLGTRMLALMSSQGDVYLSAMVDGVATYSMEVECSNVMGTDLAKIETMDCYIRPLGGFSQNADGPLMLSATVASDIKSFLNASNLSFMLVNKVPALGGLVSCDDTSQAVDTQRANRAPTCELTSTMDRPKDQVIPYYALPEPGNGQKPVPNKVN